MTLDFEITPYRNVGPIEFGMARARVRLTLGAHYSEFWKSDTSTNSSDSYDASGLIIYYDNADLVEAVEIAPPAIARFEGINLLGMPAKSVVELFHRLDEGLTVDDFGLTSLAYGVGAYIPDMDAAMDPPESVIAFRRNYYD
jgi:hypothetical protein